MKIKDQVRSFIQENFYVAEGAALADEASLLDHGIIDSTGVLEIIGFLEDTFRITIDDAEMIPENLDSIARICVFVESKRKAVTQPHGPAPDVAADSVA